MILLGSIEESGNTADRDANANIITSPSAVSDLTDNHSRRHNNTIELNTQNKYKHNNQPKMQIEREACRLHIAVEIRIGRWTHRLYLYLADLRFVIK
jgi:hypothetical protein